MQITFDDSGKVLLCLEKVCNLKVAISHQKTWKWKQIETVLSRKLNDEATHVQQCYSLCLMSMKAETRLIGRYLEKKENQKSRQCCQLVIDVSYRKLWRTKAGMHSLIFHDIAATEGWACRWISQLRRPHRFRRSLCSSYYRRTWSEYSNRWVVMFYTCIMYIVHLVLFLHSLTGFGNLTGISLYRDIQSRLSRILSRWCLCFLALRIPRHFTQCLQNFVSGRCVWWEV